MTPSTDSARRALARPRAVGSPGGWAVLFVVAVALAVWSLQLPDTATNSEQRPYLVEYDFDYTAALPPSEVYGAATALVFGQTVFLNVVDSIDASVAYRIESPEARIDEAELVLRAVLRGSAGWEREFASTGRRPFTGSETSATLPVSFAEARELAARVGAETGTTSNLTVAVVAETYVDGEIVRPGQEPGGVPELSEAVLLFSLDANVAVPVLEAAREPGGLTLPGIAPGTGGANTSSGSANTSSGSANTSSGAANTLRPPPEEDPSVVELTEMIPTDIEIPNTVSLGVVDVEVDLVRRVSLGVAVVAGLFALYGGAVVMLARRRGPVAVIVARHGSRLVPADDVALSRVKDQVEVADFEALWAVSLEVEQLVMLRWHSDDDAEFLVSDNGTVYRTTVGGGPSPTVEP